MFIFSLYDFLTNILNGIESSLGGINDFTVTYNPETNKVVIREDNNLRYDHRKSKTLSDYTKFNIGGIRQSNTNVDTSILEGSIVKNVDFNVTISPQFATMVSIGAQANANIVGEDATSLSNLYKGSVDRIVTNKTSKFFTTGKKSPKEVYKVNIELINEMLYAVYGWKQPTGLKYTLREVASTYFKFIKGWMAETKQALTPAGGFLPFDLRSAVIF